MDTRKNQFGVWLDSFNATIVEKEDANSKVKIVQHVKGEKPVANSNENTANNHENTLQQKFFKEVAHQMQNAHYIHLTGPGIAQEQFKNYLAETPQFKDVKVEMCTSTPMDDDKLQSFFEEKLN